MFLLESLTAIVEMQQNQHIAASYQAINALCSIQLEDIHKVSDYAHNVRQLLDERDMCNLEHMTISDLLNSYLEQFAIEIDDESKSLNEYVSCRSIDMLLNMQKERT